MWNHPLNRNRKLSALAKYCKWQVTSRIFTKPVIFHWVGNTKVFADKKEDGITGSMYWGLHEFEDMSLVLHATDTTDLFIDVGANIGAFTILACGVRGARGIAFEPVPAVLARMQRNVALNHLEDKVKLHNCALGAEDNSFVEFTTAENSTNHVAAAEDRNRVDKIRVPASTLDTMLGNQTATILKIDVEGFETKVLAGAKRTLSNPQLRIVIIELNGSGARYGFDEQKIVDLMLSLGFDTYSYEPFSRTLTSLAGKNSSLGNTIFVRDIESVRAKIRAAPPFMVNGEKL